MQTKKDILNDIIDDIEKEKFDENIDEGKNPFAKKGEDDEEDDEDEDNPIEGKKKEKKKVSENIKIDIDEDVEAILKGTKLSGDHKKRISTIFETALKSQVKKHILKAEAFYEEKFKDNLKAEVVQLEDKVNQYMNHVAESWLEENKLAVEQGIRADLVEGFVEDFKVLCEKHNIEISDEQVEAISEANEIADDLGTKLDEEMTKNMELSNKLKEIKTLSITENLVKDLVSTDAEKFKTLVEDVEYTSEEDYKQKCEIIKENYFKNEYKGTVENNKELAGTNNDVKDRGELSLIEQTLAALNNSNNR